VTVAIDSIAGAITFTGLGSGTDFASIIDQLIAIENYQVNRMTYWKAEWEEKITSIQGLNARVFSLYDYTKNFNEDFEFYARTTTSNDTSILSVTSTPLAKPGAHTVTVAGAVPHRMASVGFSTAADVVGGSAGEDLIISVGTTTVTVDYKLGGGSPAAGEWNENMTLTELAEAIGAADDAGSDVLEDVEIIDDGSDEYSQRLVMTAKTGGEANEIVVAADPTNLDLDGAAADMIDAEVEEEAAWTGTAPLTPDGAYNGYCNKRFNFTIATGGEVSAGGGGSAIINWSDTEGNTGSIIASTTGDFDVHQGVQLTISAGNLSTAETFALDVFNPTLQAAQDDGLARVDQITHAGFVDTNTTAVTSAAGEFTYRYAGIETTVSVEEGATLTGLVAAINSDNDNPGVTAGIINDGQGLATSYHLVLTGNDTGFPQKIEIVSETLDNFADDFTTTQEAQNAMIKADGYPVDDNIYLQRSSNRINDLIEGVELKLHDEGTVEVTVVDDKTTIAGRIATFVNSVNFVLEYINQETRYDEDTEEAGIMFGNYAFRLVKDQINSIMVSKVPDLTDGVDTYVNLAQIGIHSEPDNDGLFTIDNVTLDAALSNDLDAVAKLFITDTLLSTDGVAELMRAETYALTDSTDGPMNVLIKNYTGIIDNIDGKIEDEERRIILVEARLRAQFARLEATLSVLNQQQSQLEYQIAQLPGTKK